MEDIEAIKRVLKRERKARKLAERFLEQKSYELYLVNEELRKNNSSLEESVEIQTAKLKGINDFATILLNQVTLDQIAHSLIDIVISKFKLEHCVIYFWDDNQEYLEERAAYRSIQEKSIRRVARKIPSGAGIVGKVALSGEPLIIGDSRLTPDYLIDDKQRLSELAVPIMANQAVIGVIDSEHSSKHFFSVEHLETFITIANLASTKIKNAISMEEQSRIEQQLRASEERFRMIVENGAEMIVEMNAAGYFTYINPVFTKISGYTFEEVCDLSFLELIQPIQRKEVKAFFEHQFHNKIPETNYEFAIVNRQGMIIWISQNTMYRFADDGSLINITAVARDITDRIKYTRKLQQQEEKYRSIISNMDLGLLEVDKHDRILHANDRFCKLSGYQETELVGQKAQDVFLDEADKKALINEKNQLREEGISDKYQLRVLNKNGQYRWWLIGGAPNHDAEGKSIGSIGIHLDITDQKKQEHELEQARILAEEFAKTKERFLANMSHEIRTPLNAIMGMLREMGKGSLAPKQTSCLQNAQTASQHLLSIISNILDMSKIEAGELHLEERHFSIQSIMEETIAILQGQANEKLLDISYCIAANVSPAYIGDPTRIRQMLINIAGNAIKFTKEGGVTIYCKNKEVNGQEPELHISIVDTGIGMDATYLKNLFKQFSQEDLSTAREYGGTGLGMAITRELVLLMGGKIEADSQKGEGTIIDIFLPLALGQEEKTTKTSKQEHFISLQNLRILLVEDNEMNRVVARNTLDHFGSVVTEASNGQLAIEALEEGTFDIILMDLQMPVMGGVEATKIIRKQMGIDTPIIALTANAFKKEIDLCLSTGMNAYVTKPFEEQLLLEVILSHASQPPLAVASEKSLSLPSSPDGSVKADMLFDLSHLRELSRGNEEFVVRMVEMFVNQVTSVIQELEPSFEGRDFNSLYTYAHGLKPMIDTMRIDILKEDIREIERQAHQEEILESLPELIRRTKHTLQQVVLQLQDDVLA
ncbi:MAG: PAS domain S-box protein [Bacteroidota bacterium]